MRRPENRRDFPLTEAGDAEHFASMFGDQLLFDHRRGRWLVFRRHRWTEDGDGKASRLALKAMRSRQKYAMTINHESERQICLKWAIGGEARKRIENMLAL